MTSFIITVHIIVCLILIVVILLQTGSAGGMGAAFGGGGSQTLFGGSGSGKFFTRLTAIVAGIFMITSISLTVMSSHRAKGTVMQDYKPSAVTVPAKPEPAVIPVEKPASVPAAPAAQEKPATKSVK